jgi:hypothetical protein
MEVIALQDEEWRSLARVDRNKVLCRGKRRVLRPDAVNSFAGIWRECGNVNQAGDVGCSRGSLGNHGASVRVTHHDGRPVESGQIPLHRPGIIGEGGQRHLAGNYTKAIEAYAKRSLKKWSARTAWKALS